MNRRDVQEKLFAVAAGDAADAELGELCIVPAKREVTIQSLVALMNAAGAASSTIHIALESAPTVALVSVATTSGSGVLTKASAPYTYQNTGSTAVKLVVVVGGTAPAQIGTVAVKYSPAEVPA